MKKKQCNNIRNNKRCKRDATYVCESIFGEVYYCSYHIKKKRENICIRNCKKK